MSDYLDIMIGQIRTNCGAGNSPGDPRINIAAVAGLELPIHTMAPLYAGQTMINGISGIQDMHRIDVPEDFILIVVGWQNSDTCVVKRLDFNSKEVLWSRSFFSNLGSSPALCCANENGVFVSMWMPYDNEHALIYYKLDIENGNTLASENPFSMQSVSMVTDLDNLYYTTYYSIWVTPRIDAHSGPGYRPIHFLHYRFEHTGSLTQIAITDAYGTTIGFVFETGIYFIPGPIQYLSAERGKVDFFSHSDAGEGSLIEFIRMPEENGLKLYDFGDLIIDLPESSSWSFKMGSVTESPLGYKKMVCMGNPDYYADYYISLNDKYIVACSQRQNWDTGGGGGPM